MASTDPSVLTFALGDERLAIPVGRVREILDMRPIQPLPQAPDYILGHIDLRGESILTVDFRKMMRRRDRPDDPHTRIVVLWVETASGGTVIALRTDRVFEVTQLDDDKITGFATGDILNWDSRMVRGVGHLDGDPITVLCPDAMFRSEVLATLQAEAVEASEDCSA